MRLSAPRSALMPSAGLLLLLSGSAYAMATPKVTLKYFPFAGAAEKVRLALWLGGIPFDDVRVPFDEWAELKPTTPYGQVPVMSIDGGPYLSQSMAMLRWCGAQAPALYPAEKLLEIEETLGLCDDFVRAWAPCLYIGMNPAGYGYGAVPSTALERGSDDHAATVKTMRERFLEAELPKYAQFFSDRLAQSGGPFVCGAAPTLADCYLVPELEKFGKGFVDHVPTDCLEAYPALGEYIAAFNALPQVRAYAQAQG